MIKIVPSLFFSFEAQLSSHSLHSFARIIRKLDSPELTTHRTIVSYEILINHLSVIGQQNTRVLCSRGVSKYDTTLGFNHLPQKHTALILGLDHLLIKYDS